MSTIYHFTYHVNGPCVGLPQTVATKWKAFPEKWRPMDLEWDVQYSHIFLAI